MRTQKIDFSTRQVLCVFPREPADLGPALSELHLNEGYPVIVLIGGEIDAPQADATRHAIQTIARIAHDMNALIICGGTDIGIMAETDRLGVDLMARAGYSPQGMVSLLQKQKTYETERAANPQAWALDQRLLGIDATEKGQQQIEKAQAKLGKQAELFGALASAALKGTKELVDRQLDQDGRSHPKTKERIGDVEEYLAKQYGGLSAQQPNVEGWEAAKDADGTVEVLENYIAAIEAKGKLADGDVAAARSLARSALTGPTLLE